MGQLPYEQEPFSRKRIGEVQLNQAIDEQVSRLEGKDAATRRAAIEALYDLCRENDGRTKRAVPALITCLGDEDKENWEGIEYALYYCGADAVEPLRGALSNPNRLVRLRAAGVFGKGGNHAQRALPELRKAIEDSDPEVRAAAAQAVRLVSRGEEDDIELLLTLAKSKQTSDRVAALNALGTIAEKEGAKGESHRWRDLVMEGLKDAEKDIRQAAYSALESLEIASSEKVVLYAKSIEESDSLFPLFA